MLPLMTMPTTIIAIAACAGACAAMVGSAPLFARLVWHTRCQERRLYQQRVANHQWRIQRHKALLATLTRGADTGHAATPPL